MVLVGWVEEPGTFLLRVRADSIVCSMLLIGHSNQAVLSLGRPAQHASAYTSSDVLCWLSCALNSQKKITHSLLSVCLSLPFFIFFSLSDTNDCSPHPW